MASAVTKAKLPAVKPAKAKPLKAKTPFRAEDCDASDIAEGDVADCGTLEERVMRQLNQVSLDREVQRMLRGTALQKSEAQGILRGMALTLAFPGEVAVNASRRVAATLVNR